MKIVITGHVDDGKSTFIGRMLYETNSLQDGKIEELKKICEKRAMQFEWSFVLDAFQAERNQAITIDTCWARIKSEFGDIIFIDVPGHFEFLKNMISGAANADAGFLVIDALEGIREQTKRHLYILQVLGIKNIIVIINKMDLVNYSEKNFFDISNTISLVCKQLKMNIKAIIPTSARLGDNLVNQSKNMPWYIGLTVFESIKELWINKKTKKEDFRMSLQDIYKFDERRILVGKVLSGTVKVGDELLFSPSGKTTKVKSIESWNAASIQSASLQQSIGITLEDQIFVERGEIISHIDTPPSLTNLIQANIFWFGKTPLEKNKDYKIRSLTKEVDVRVEEINFEIQLSDFTKNKVSLLQTNGFGEVLLSTRESIALDEYADLPNSGRFVMIENYEIVGGGLVLDVNDIAINKANKNSDQKFNKLNEDFRINKNDRVKQRKRHIGGVLWFTGLSGAGKTSLATKVQHELLLNGHDAYVLDADIIRMGLNSDLGYTIEDRIENMRRIAEVARLFADAGFICLVACIAPLRAEREKLFSQFREKCFHEIYVKAELSTCEMRDPKGLYKKVRLGKLNEFTGISSIYEPPLNPDLLIDTDRYSLKHSTEILLEYIDQHFAIKKERFVSA